MSGQVVSIVNWLKSRLAQLFELIAALASEQVLSLSLARLPGFAQAPNPDGQWCMEGSSSRDLSH